MAMEGVWSDHTEAALLILGLGSILTRQYLRAAKAWQEYGKGRGQKAQPAPTGWLTPPQPSGSLLSTRIQVHVREKNTSFP